MNSWEKKEAFLVLNFFLSKIKYATLMVALGLIYWYFCTYCLFKHAEKFQRNRCVCTLTSYCHRSSLLVNPGYFKWGWVCLQLVICIKYTHAKGLSIQTQFNSWLCFGAYQLQAVCRMQFFCHFFVNCYSEIMNYFVLLTCRQFIQILLFLQINKSA